MELIQTAMTGNGLVYENGGFHPEQRTIAEDKVWKVFVNGRELESFSSSPVQMAEAAYGYLRLHERISAREDVESLEIRPEQSEIYAQVLTPAEFTKGKPGMDTLSPDQVFALLGKLSEYRQAGVHSCALVQGDGFVCRNDVSRGASVDKAAGACLLQGIPTKDSVLVFSGRIPLSVAEKAYLLGCRIIVAVSGPTDLACRFAEEKGITLVCSAGDGRFCVYTQPQRIQ